MVALTSSAMATFSFTPHQSSLSPPLLQNQSSLFSTSSSSSSTTTNSYRKNSYGLPSMSISNTHYSTIHHHYHEDGNLGNRMPRELYAPRCYAPSEKNHRSVRTRVTDITGSSPSPSPSSSSSSSSSGSDGEAIASSFASDAPVARLVAQRSQSITVHELDRPLAEYMSLPASQYSVLDAERIERVDDNTFRCYVYRFSFFNFEVCPVLLVKVDERSNGCCIRLLSCTLEGSPIVVAQNKKFSASMVNTVSWSYSKESSTNRKLESDTTIEVVIEIPGAFRAIPAGLIESTGKQILSQLLGVMLPRFLAQLEKDYRAWASGDSSRRPLGTGEI